MGVAEAVVDTEVGGVVIERHGGADIIAQAHGPIEVFIPVGAVAASDITYGATIVAHAEHGFAKAGGGLEFVGQATVAYH